jgi:hypothetical protein
MTETWVSSGQTTLNRVPLCVFACCHPCRKVVEVAKYGRTAEWNVYAIASLNPAENLRNTCRQIEQGT